MVRDIMFKRRKLWYKMFKTLYEPSLVNQSRANFRNDQKSSIDLFDINKFKNSEKTEIAQLPQHRSSNLVKDRVSQQLHQMMMNNSKKEEVNNVDHICKQNFRFIYTHFSHSSMEPKTHRWVLS